MLSDYLINEIKNRDFFKNVDHFHDHDEIQTDLILGTPSKKPDYLTIIIPVYDHPLNFIIRAINSALNQEGTSVSYKVLIIEDYAFPDKDNGVEKYLNDNPNDKILYYKNRKNLGVFGNWNRGIQLANSEWVTLLHSDDFYKANFLKNMLPIILNDSSIDQLACKYELLDYTKDNVDESSLQIEPKGNTTLRKVDYREYMYEMFTSVKGSIYKKKTLLDIGGFRSQDVALGLDDYSLMMRYAYYYNTFYLDAVLYVDSWGFNDSLNTKHWYPQLIADYYMWKSIEKKRSGLIRYAYEQKDKYFLITRAREFADGTSYIKKKIPIDFEELYKVCDITSEEVNTLPIIIGKGLVKIDQFIIKNSQKKKRIELK